MLETTCRKQLPSQNYYFPFLLLPLINSLNLIIFFTLFQMGSSWPIGSDEMCLLCVWGSCKRITLSTSFRTKTHKKKYLGRRVYELPRILSCNLRTLRDIFFPICFIYGVAVESEGKSFSRNGAPRGRIIQVKRIGKDLYGIFIFNYIAYSIQIVKQFNF